MLRDVPHCRSILMCGMGGFVLSVIFLTLVYPAFCNKVSEVKQIKVREYMQDRYGVDGNSASLLRSRSGWDTELSKGVQPESTTAAATALDANYGEARVVRHADASPTPDRDDPLPPAKRN